MSKQGYFLLCNKIYFDLLKLKTLNFSKIIKNINFADFE